MDPKSLKTKDSFDDGAFSFVDFKLLHHWNVSTAESLAENRSLQRAMREVIPLLALSHRISHVSYPCIPTPPALLA